MTRIKRDVNDIDEVALLQSIYEQDNSNSGMTQSKVHGKSTATVLEQTDNQDDSEEIEEVKEVTAFKVTKEQKEPVKRKRSHSDYSSLFLQRNELKDRSCVYISRRIHKTISEIVRVIADRDTTVGGFIDNILLQHLELHKDEINELYKKERADLIQ